MKEEYALTILLSNPILDSITQKKIEHILKHSVNWKTVFLISLEEKTTFIICKNLLYYRYFWMVPDSLWMVWHAAYIGNSKKNEELLNYYTIVSEKFSKNRIMAIPCSGITLLTTVYADSLGIRILHDIDFVTHKKHLKNIDLILNDFGFKKLYVDDKDILANSLHQTFGYDTLYSKSVNGEYINFDFCYGLEGKNNLFKFLIHAMNCRNKTMFHVAQLIILYLTAEKSWNGTYFTKQIKKYTYARLIDIHLYKNKFATSEILMIFEQKTIAFKINHIIKDINTAIEFFRKGAYLT